MKRYRLGKALFTHTKENRYFSEEMCNYLTEEELKLFNATPCEDQYDTVFPILEDDLPKPKKIDIEEVNKLSRDLREYDKQKTEFSIEEFTDIGDYWDSSDAYSLAMKMNQLIKWAKEVDKRLSDLENTK